MNYLKVILSISAVAALAVIFKMPLIFPSLGPSALLFFNDDLTLRPKIKTVFLGHTIGILSGFVAIQLFCLRLEHSQQLDSLNYWHIATAALAVSLTGFLMKVSKQFHAPAGASALIVGLGLIFSLTAVSKLILGALVFSVVLRLVSFIEKVQ